MTDQTMIERVASIPRWALERAEEEKARYYNVVPNSGNVDIWLGNPSGWGAYFVLADYIARTETPLIDAALAEDEITR